MLGWEKVRLGINLCEKADSGVFGHHKHQQLAKPDDDRISRIFVLVLLALAACQPRLF